MKQNVELRKWSTRMKKKSKCLPWPSGLPYPTHQIRQLWDRRSDQSPSMSVSICRVGIDTQKSTFWQCQLIRKLNDSYFIMSDENKQPHLHIRPHQWDGNVVCFLRLLLSEPLHSWGLTGQIQGKPTEPVVRSEQLYLESRYLCLLFIHFIARLLTAMKAHYRPAFCGDLRMKRKNSTRSSRQQFTDCISSRRNYSHHHEICHYCAVTALHSVANLWGILIQK